MKGEQSSVPIEDFESFYRSRQDPYEMTTRWYEQRKRALTVAALPREHYAAALEVACGEGALTLLLAARCDRVVATDGSVTARERARDVLRTCVNVEIAEHVLPAAPPSGPYDLVVLAEVGYFLDPTDLRLTGRGLIREMNAGGDLVAVHWRHPSPNYPLDGPRVHAILDEMAGTSRVAHLEDEDFVLDVWRRDHDAV